MPQVSVTVDPKTKESMERFCDEAGISLSTALNVYMKKVVRDWKIPFEITGDDPFYNAPTTRRIMKAWEQVKTTGGTPHELIELGLDDE